MKLNGSGIIATHDLELGDLAEEYPGKIFNNCFEPTLQKKTIISININNLIVIPAQAGI